MIKFILLALFSTAVGASSCPQLYPDSKPIKIPNTIELCNSFYVVLFSRNHNGPVLVSERLKAGVVVGKLNRSESFRSDPRLGSRSPRSSQFRNTGYDRGHMAPSDNSSTSQEMSDTYLLSNMTPQSPRLNRGPWKRLESEIRKLHNSSATDTYVVTVAVYRTYHKVNDLSVPDQYWKIVYKDGSRVAYTANNTDSSNVHRAATPLINSLTK